MDDVFYYTVKAISEGFYKEKGSKFLGFAHPVNSKDEIKLVLDDYKKQYYDARHVCFAYALGFKGEDTRAYDDGEPGHSAGDPILGQINSFELTNVLIIVIRYFGGTKLGVGGLVTAYKTAAEEALKNAIIIKRIPTEVVKHMFSYEEMNRVMGIVKQYDLEIESQDFKITCEIKLLVPLALVEVVTAKLKSEYA